VESSAPTAMLEMRDLAVVHAGAELGPVTIIHDVSFSLERGQRIGIVGESGSGKSLTALSLIGLLPPNLTASGTAHLGDADLLGLTQRELGGLRGNEIGFIFQDPMTSLNPVRSVGSLLTEALKRHRSVSKSEARELVVDALAAVGIPFPEERLGVYPHQLSGGMRQRVMIALALINHPSLILADEPTTALDTTIQAQIMELLVQRCDDAALLLITHDLGVAAEVCDHIAVMYSGTIVEIGPTESVLRHPRHPYTVALLEAAPSFDRTRELRAIPGAPPSPFDRPVGCSFAPRCSRALEQCRVEEPILRTVGSSEIACWNPHD
jgi:oligopeptide/dipeptide ABC transporter ATP-binding protein